MCPCSDEPPAALACGWGHAGAHVRTHTHTRARTRTCTHAYTHTHVHTRTRTHTRALFNQQPVEGVRWPGGWARSGSASRRVLGLPASGDQSQREVGARERVLVPLLWGLIPHLEEPCGSPPVPTLCAGLS